MTWNYRIIKDKDGYWLAEVLSDDKGKVQGWYKRPDMVCTTREELLAELKLIYEDALKSPVMVEKGKQLKVLKK